MTTRGQEGATAAEYAIMISLIALAIFGAVVLLGEALGEHYDCTASHVEQLTQDPGSPDC